MQDSLSKDIRIVIVEDETHNSRWLQGLINELRPGWKVEASLESIEESVEWFDTNDAPDLIVMDIQLSDGICFSIFDKVDLPTSCRIIFTTAYDEYAIRAFKVNSIDYLLKPIEKNALESSFLKFEELAGYDSVVKDAVDYSKLVTSILQGKKEYRTRFLISGVNSYQKLETKDIAYFYSENKITFGVSRSNVEYTLDFTLEQLESELDPSVFFRANRKTIVHIDSVTKISNETGSKLRIELSPLPNFEILVSRLKVSDFKIWMGK